ncbi:MAG: GIY-YIG nuclease family protein [Gammaproteobacteria bacterium]|nr:GIY-YIG nuclease family protein [Gammaproteobacteria bacterium]
MTIETGWLSRREAELQLDQPLSPDWVSYQLGIKVDQPMPVQVGRLGGFEFAAGCYVYTGSARRNFVHRVQRHLVRLKTVRWHIDYLLIESRAEVIALGFSATSECVLNQRLAGQVWPMGFGASDCRSGCGGHLKRVLPDIFGGLAG